MEYNLIKSGGDVNDIRNIGEVLREKKLRRFLRCIHMPIHHRSSLIVSLPIDEIYLFFLFRIRKHMNFVTF